MMPRVALATFGLAVLLPLAGCPGSAAAPAAPRPPIRVAPARTSPPGADAYKASCSACHGPDGRGLPNIGKDLVTGEFGRTQTDDQLLEFIKVGRGASDPLNTTKVAMPPKGGNPALSDHDIRAIIGHLRALQQAARP